MLFHVRPYIHKLRMFAKLSSTSAVEESGSCFLGQRKELPRPIGLGKVCGLLVEAEISAKYFLLDEVNKHLHRFGRFMVEEKEFAFTSV
ncbi:MAG: hypothetical protein LBT59_01850 [Clostridiales bacterium]|nr:hypothetical protein [Clostridiales bacterium]